MSGLLKTGVATLLSASAIAAPIAQARQPTADYISPIAANAENIRSLNIMLMVTSLRCRSGAHDFSGEYELFAQAHQQNLAEAHNHLTRDLVATYGESGSNRALDRIGVSIANSYGDGHPTLGCSDLKQATLELAMSQSKTELAQMAEQLLDRQLSAPESELDDQVEATDEAAWAHKKPKKPRAPQSPDPVVVDEEDRATPPPVRVYGWMRG